MRQTRQPRFYGFIYKYGPRPRDDKEDILTINTIITQPQGQSQIKQSSAFSTSTPFIIFLHAKLPYSQTSTNMPYAVQGMMPGMAATNAYPSSTRRSSKSTDTSTLRSDSSSLDEKKSPTVSWTEVKSKDAKSKKSTMSRIVEGKLHRDAVQTEHG